MTDVTGAVGRSPVVRVSADVTAASGDRVLAAARDSADSLAVVRTGPTGIAELEPLVVATEGGRTAFFASPAPSTVRDLVASFESEGLPTDGADAVVEHDPEVSSLPVPTDGPLSVGQRRVLGPCGWVDPLDPTDRTFVSTEYDASAVADVGLLGRGRGDAAADDPVGDVWKRARETDGESVVVVNANEADDRQRADRTLLAGAPMAVLDGAAAVAEYVDAEDVVLYLNESDGPLQRHVRRAVEAVEDELTISPQVVAGPDEYRAGAPTAALEALEGADRIEPRIQPPTPAEHGLYGRPTVVHTPRTFAQVGQALRSQQTPEMTDADSGTQTDADPTTRTDTDSGTRTDPDSTTETNPDSGTRLVTVTGDVAAPATVELGSNESLAYVREAVRMDESFKMACVGGVFGGVTAELDVPPTAKSLEAAGLGTDGVVELLSDDRCAVATVGERARFASTANSGRCVPGREGTKQLTELLREIYQGAFRTDEIRELGRVMRRTSNCQIGAHAPRPVTTAMDEFEPEFRAHARGRCPSGTCEEKL